MNIKPGSVSLTVCVAVITLVAISAPAEQLHSEKYYQMRWCFSHGGMVGIMLGDKTRCDCVTESHAIEIEFADKWADAIGQSLYYSLQTGKIAGIVLILESETDHKYWEQLNSTIENFELPIETWEISPGQ